MALRGTAAIVGITELPAQRKQTRPELFTVDQYAALMAADPATFAAYYRWDVYCLTTAGDVLLPIGYDASSPIPAADYVAAHPQ